jgi:hypothetical protein
MPTNILEYFARWDRERRARAASMRSAARRVEAGQRHLQRVLDADPTYEEDTSWSGGDTRPLGAHG